MLRNFSNFQGFMTQNTLFGIPTIGLGILVSGAFFTQPSVAQSLNQEQTFFNRAPRLVRTAASSLATMTPATYQFTLEVPPNAGAPLQAVKIAPEQNFRTADLNQTQATAFLGNSFAGGTPLPLASIGGEQPANHHEVTVVFNPPIAPGQTVTVSVPADRNPDDAGVYLFGVTAYPQGNNSPGLFLGYGRVDIYDNMR